MIVPRRSQMFVAIIGHFSGLPSIVGHRENTILELLAKVFKNDIADQCGNRGNHEICSRNNIPDGENQTLPLLTIGVREFSHQEIRIK
jgi:hypothetical protein